MFQITKLASILLIMISAAAFTGCGDDDESPSNDATDTLADMGGEDTTDDSDVVDPDVADDSQEEDVADVTNPSGVCEATQTIECETMLIVSDCESFADCTWALTSCADDPDDDPQMPLNCNNFNGAGECNSTNVSDPSKSAKDYCHFNSAAPGACEPGDRCVAVEGTNGGNWNEATCLAGVSNADGDGTIACYALGACSGGAVPLADCAANTTQAACSAAAGNGDPCAWNDAD